MMWILLSNTNTNFVLWKLDESIENEEKNNEQKINQIECDNAKRNDIWNETERGQHRKTQKPRLQYIYGEFCIIIGMQSANAFIDVML